MRVLREAADEEGPRPQPDALRLLGGAPLRPRQPLATRTPVPDAEVGRLMARIRSIKPSFWGSPEVASMSRDARLLVLGLISTADDDGRFLASPAAMSGAVFPNDDITPARIRAWFAEAVETGMVYQYRWGAVQYGCFPSWHKHQVINRYTPSTLPAPDTECWPRSHRKGGDD